jgi:preprotein translocase subunit SecF
MRFFPRNTKINFIKARYAAFILSALILCASVFLLFERGLAFGIDFTGGTLIEVRVPVDQPDLGALRGELNALGLGSISIQEFGAPNDLLIRMPEQEGDAQAQQAAIEDVREALDARYDSVENRRTEFVGPQVGEELKRKGLYAVLFSMLGMLIYIWFRFEWQFSVAAIVALLHDAVATVGLFALMGWEFNLSTVAAILLIAGYSINDTVVVFDRIRENLRKFKKMPAEDLLNLSINQTLSRTIMTAVTTVLALVSLWLFGGEVIRGFVNALIFGIIIGTYSSIFIAAPLLTFTNIRHTRRQKEEAQAENAAA